MAARFTITMTVVFDDGSSFVFGIKPSLKIQLTGPSYVIFRHTVGSGGRFLRAVKHSRSRKRAAIIHVIARPGCWNMRRVVVVPYIPPSGKLPEYSVFLSLK